MKTIIGTGTGWFCIKVSQGLRAQLNAALKAPANREVFLEVATQGARLLSDGSTSWSAIVRSTATAQRIRDVLWQAMGNVWVSATELTEQQSGGDSMMTTDEALLKARIVVELMDGKLYGGETYSEIVEQMRDGSWGGEQSDGMRGYMRQVAKRIWDWSQVRVRVSRPELFIIDLAKANTLRVRDRS
jgi:hypothetical protein